jgi:hypothetical protein
MDIEDTESGSGDKINGVDGFLVATGVAAIALVPTYAALLVAPQRLADRLDPRQFGKRDWALLGPGSFFVASVLLVILVGMFLTAGLEAPDTAELESARKTGVAYSFGAAIGGTMKGLENTLRSGDFWNAAAIAMPIFGFVVALAFPLRALIGSAAPRFRAVQAVAASLYMVGGLMVGTCAVVIALMVASPLIGRMAASGLGVICILGIVLMTSLQTYHFGQAYGPVRETRLGIACALTPMATGDG